MYKKITHNIVEEHFDYPMPEEKSTISNNKNKIPTTTIFNEASFKKDVDSFLKTYGEKLINTADQLTGSEEDLINAFEALFVNIDDLGNTTKNFYASDLGERINITMRSLALLTFIAVNNLKLGRDPQNNFNRMNVNASDLATVLSTFNSLWDPFTVRTVLQKIVSSLQAKLKARKEKNATAEQAANTSILEQFKIFGDTVSSGIVRKFPQRFNTIATTNDKNIM
jgi:hypothetical protein